MRSTGGKEQQQRFEYTERYLQEEEKGEAFEEKKN